LSKAVAGLKKANEELHRDVRGCFDSTNRRPVEASRSTTQGLVFEAEVCSTVETEVRRLNDFFG
jgi:hypothetical protein